MHSPAVDILYVLLSGWKQCLLGECALELIDLALLQLLRDRDCNAIAWRTNNPRLVHAGMDFEYPFASIFIS